MFPSQETGFHTWMFSWASEALMSRRNLTSSRWYLPILIEFRANSQTISYPATCRKSNFIPPPFFFFFPEIKKSIPSSSKWFCNGESTWSSGSTAFRWQLLDQHNTPGQHNWQRLDGCHSDSPAKRVPLSHYIWWRVEMPQPKWGKAPSVVINSRGSGFRRTSILWVF